MEGNIAFIPVRGGSKSIPLKNIKLFCGKPLVYWVAKAASDCSCIDKVYVSTDCKEISEVVNDLALPKIQLVKRSIETATDSSSTELAMLEFAQLYDFQNIVLIQATSPLLMTDDLHNGFDVFFKPGVDSVVSVVRQKRFIWSKSKNGSVQSVNYDPKKRPRRQEWDGFLVENGAFYITSKRMLLKNRCRLSGNVYCCEMNEDSYFEIDEPDDWPIMETILKQRLKRCQT